MSALNCWFFKRKAKHRKECFQKMYRRVSWNQFGSTIWLALRREFTSKFQESFFAFESMPVSLMVFFYEILEDEPMNNSNFA